MESKRACIYFLDAVSVYLLLMRCTKVFLGGGGGLPGKVYFTFIGVGFGEGFEAVACVLIGPTLEAFLLINVSPPHS